MADWPLVGRRDELEFVGGLIDRRRGPGVVLAGAAGVGKSRLARELLEQAKSRGWCTAWVPATRSAMPIQFGAFAHLLPADLNVFAPANLLRAASNAILRRCEDGQLVLGVDDAHLLDDSSAALVAHLVQAATCFVVVTVRSGEGAPEAIVGLWKDRALDRVELQALSRDEVAELVTAVLGAPPEATTLHRFWSASRGNLLYLRELVLGALQAGTLTETRGLWRWHGEFVATPQLTQLLDDRLGDLPASQRHVLEIVALSEPVEEAFLSALVGPVDLEAVHRRGLLEVVRDDRRRFLRLAHPLYSERIRATTPPLVVRSTSQRLADLVQAAGARRRGDLLRLASWRLEANDASDPELLVSAARRANALQDFQLVERLARAAIDGGGGFDAAFLAATAAIGRGYSEQADELFADLVARAATDDQRARAAIGRSDNLHFRLRRSADAIAALEEAIREIPDGSPRARLLAAHASRRISGGDAHGGVIALERLLERAWNDPVLLNEVATGVVWGWIITGRAQAATDFASMLLPLVEQQSAPESAYFGPVFLRPSLCAAALIAGRISEAENWASTAYETATSGGPAGLSGFEGLMLGWTRRVIGRPRAAKSVLDNTVLALGHLDFFRLLTPCLGELAHCAALVGDCDAADAALAEADAAADPSYVLDYGFVELARAWTASARGESSLARTLVNRCAVRCTSFGQSTTAAFAWHDLVRLGDPAGARVALAELAGQVDGDLVPTLARHAEVAAAHDPVGLQGVAETFDEMGAVLFAAEAWVEAASAWRTQGRNASAHAAAAQARRLAARCEGARTPILADLGGSLPLTPRQREIATLAARGLTNREIAERLVVSVRTVDNHLHAVFTTLNVAHRDELAAILLPADR